MKKKSVSSGSLPPGLSLNVSTGVISGTPTTSGLFSFGIRASNRANQTYTRSFSIQINERIQIQTTHLPNAFVGRFYSQTIQVTGTMPISWGLESGSLPPGLGLNRTTGAIVGTPTASGQFDFTVRATNPVGMVVHPFSIIVNNTQPQAYDAATISVIDPPPCLVVLSNDDVVDGCNDIWMGWYP